MAIKSKKTATTAASKTPASKAAPAKAAASKASAGSQPKLVVSQQELEQRIRDRAYFNFLNRGTSQSGCADQDWYEAEKQVKKELGIR